MHLSVAAKSLEERPDEATCTDFEQDRIESTQDFAILEHKSQHDGSEEEIEEDDDIQ